MRICAPNEISKNHLAEVIEEMKKIGTPTIRAYYTGELYVAIEGSHRLAACSELGITPNIIEIYEDTVIDDHDFDDLPKTASGLDFSEYLGNATEWVFDFESNH